jgi:catechol 2,3-dioxygenase-like lactoylglutathione lyase family enzyme
VFDHVTIRVSDRDASQRFYDTVLRTLGIEQTAADEWEDFALYAADSGAPVTSGLHVGFVAPTRAETDEFWRVGTGAFVLDPDGHNVEIVNHNR